MKKLICVAGLATLLAAPLAGCGGDDMAPEAMSDAIASDAGSSSGAEEGMAASGAEVRLYAFDCGRIEMLDLSIFASNGEYDGRQNSAADMCFLVRHPDGDLMWDSGLPSALAEMEDGLTNGPFRVSVPVTLAEQMQTIGLTPADIEYFSVSHSHFDHVGNAPMFAGSVFLVDQDERAHMFRAEARADAESFAAVAPLEAAETVAFDGDYDVFGDGSVMIIALPGHTPGHTGLLVNLQNEGPVLLSGDLYHLREARDIRSVPQFNTDAEETLASMDRFEALAAETGARVIIQHSLEHYEELPRLPGYID